MFYRLSVADIQDEIEPAVFVNPWGTPGRFRARELYHPICCKKCGSFNPLEAADLGIESAVRGPTVSGDYDVVDSFDGQYLVSSRAREVFSRICSGYVRFLPLPGDKRYHLLLPLAIYPMPEVIPFHRPGLPWPLVPFRRIRNPCVKCGRYHDVSFRPECLKLPVDTKFSCIGIPGGNEGVSFTWAMSNEIADQIRRENLTGVRILPDQFDVQ